MQYIAGSEHFGSAVSIKCAYGQLIVNLHGTLKIKLVQSMMPSKITMELQIIGGVWGNRV